MTRELQKALDNRPQIPVGPVTEGPLKGLCQSCREPVPATKLARMKNWLKTTLILCDDCGTRWVSVNGEMGVEVDLSPLPPHLVYDGPVPSVAAPVQPSRDPKAPKKPSPAPKAPPRSSQSEIEADMDEFLATFG